MSNGHTKEIHLWSDAPTWIKKHPIRTVVAVATAFLSGAVTASGHTVDAAVSFPFGHQYTAENMNISDTPVVDIVRNHHFQLGNNSQRLVLEIGVGSVRGRREAKPPFTPSDSATDAGVTPFLFSPHLGDFGVVVGGQFYHAADQPTFQQHVTMVDTNSQNTAPARPTATPRTSPSPRRR